jgi:hypothetical protein
MPYACFNAKYSPIMSTIESIFFYGLFIAYFCVLVWGGTKVTRKQNELFARHGITFKGRGRYEALEKIMTPEEKQELTAVGSRFAKYAGYGFLLVAAILVAHYFLK